jgi:uncharacterized protein
MEAAPVKIEGQHRFEAPRDLVWKALLDPEILAKTLPGCEKLERTGEQTFHGALVMKVGPVQGQFQGEVQLSDLRPLEGYHLKLHGQGGPGFVDGQGDLRLEEQDGGTNLTYTVDAQVGGRIASVGQRLLDSSARVITRQALESLGQQIAALAAAQAAPEAPPPKVEGPTQAQFAAQFATGLARELVPAPLRPVLLVAALLVAALLVFILLRACRA